MVVQDACQEAVEHYMRALRGEVTVSCTAPNVCRLTMPFGRPDGELIGVELTTLPGGQIRLSDAGDSVGYLYLNGLTVSRALLDTAQRSAYQLGVSLDRYELTTTADRISDVGDRLHALSQAIVRVSDLIQKRRPSERLQFDVEVEAFLVGNRVIYDSDYRVPGERESHQVRFHMNSQRHSLVQPLSAASESAAHGWAERWAYRFGDIMDRDRLWQSFVVLDDRGSRQLYWTPAAVAPLSGFAEVVLWREKERLADALLEVTSVDHS